MSSLLSHNMEQEISRSEPTAADSRAASKAITGETHSKTPTISYPNHRRANRRRRARFGVFSVTIEGHRIEPLNVSNGGIALLIPAHLPLSIEDRLAVRLHQNDFHIATLEVRVVHASRSAAGMIVGGAFEKVEIVPTSRNALPRNGDIVEIRDDALKASVFKAIVARPITGTVRLGRDRVLRVALEESHDVPSSFLLRSEGAELACSDEEVITIALDLRQCELLLRGRVTRVGGDLVLSAPWRLFSLGRRRCQRVLIPPAEAVLEWRDPLDPDHTRAGRVVDLSPQGIGVGFPRDALYLFPAPPFPVTLRIGDLTMSLLAEVDHCNQADNTDSIVGLSVRPFQRADTILLAEVCQLHRCRNLVKRHTVDPAAITKFMQESGYLDLRRGTTPDPDWHAPAGDESLSLDTAYLGDNGSVLGHVSCLRLYRRTWIYHQLATVGLRRATIAYPLYLQLTEWTTALADTQEGYVIAYFDPTKPWHQLMQGAFLKWVGSEELSVTKGLDRLEAIDLDLPLAAVDGRICVGEASKDELSFAVTLARVHLPKLLADALQMDVEWISTTNLCDEHTSFGLDRARVTFVAKVGSRILGTAVCETGARRLSLFNILNVAYVFLVEPMELDLARLAETALLSKVRRYYRDLHVLDPLIVAPEGNVKFAHSAGLTIAETMAAWVTSLDGLRQWRNFIHFEMGQMTRGRRLKNALPQTDPVTAQVSQEQ